MKATLLPSRFQFVCMIVLLPVILFLLLYILAGDGLFQHLDSWLRSFLLLLLMGFLSASVQAGIQNLLKQRLPSLRQTQTRVAWLLAGIIPFTLITVLLVAFLCQHLAPLPYLCTPYALANALLAGFCANALFSALYEVDYLLQRCKESFMEKETLKQQRLQHEYDVLKNQVNPHFLFNCFNTLSSLITEDKEKAEEFLNELSIVYRYLLRNNEDGLSTVENEVRFIRSYYGLLKTRHGDAVEMTIKIDRQYNACLLPSLSLQLLVENVVKHNRLAKAHPLSIEIFTTPEHTLLVRNNLQRRTAKAPGNKVGLDNIRAKYDLLNQPGFKVMTDDKKFTVVLPLIWKNTIENSTHFFEKIKTT